MAIITYKDKLERETRAHFIAHYQACTRIVSGDEGIMLTAQETLKQANKLHGRHLNKVYTVQDVYITAHNSVQIEAFGTIDDWIYRLTHPGAEHRFAIYSVVDDRMNDTPYVLIQLATSDMRVKCGHYDHVACMVAASWIEVQSWQRVFFKRSNMQSIC